jgi:hypothetical protein
VSDNLVPSDAGWTEDKLLVADLAHLNAEVGRYVLRYFDVDAGHAEPVSAAYEDAFGQRLIGVGERVRQRVARRATDASGTVPAHQLLEPGRCADREDGP